MLQCDLSEVPPEHRDAVLWGMFAQLFNSVLHIYPMDGADAQVYIIELRDHAWADVQSRLELQLLLEDETHA